MTICFNMQPKNKKRVGAAKCCYGGDLLLKLK